jgi:uncharacterized protein YjbI with pentapeptide repeats
VAPRRSRRAPRVAPSAARILSGALDAGDEWRDLTITGDAAGVVAGSLTIVGCVLRGVVLTGAGLDRLSLTNCVLEDCELTGVAADRIDVLQCELLRCRMDAFDGGRGRWRDVALRDCTLRDASLRMTTWQHAALTDTRLSNADFTGATFDDVAFTGCDLRGATFWDASLGGVELYGSDLDRLRGGLALRGVRIDAVQLVDVARAVFEALDIEVREH